MRMTVVERQINTVRLELPVLWCNVHLACGAGPTRPGMVLRAPVSMVLTTSGALQPAQSHMQQSKRVLFKSRPARRTALHHGVCMTSAFEVNAGMV